MTSHQNEGTPSQRTLKLLCSRYRIKRSWIEEYRSSFLQQRNLLCLVPPTSCISLRIDVGLLRWSGSTLESVENLKMNKTAVTEDCVIGVCMIIDQKD